jgi:16S rRNA (cytosine967-C5)-methyltransferase
MPTPARRVAFTILLRTETQSSYATELLHGPLTADLSVQDAALSTELVLGTLRRQATLDFIAQQFTQKKWGSLDAEVRVALRMGLYQLRFLTRIPARAAVHESVELIKAAGKRSAAGLVNAVLRKGAEVDLIALRSPSMSESEWLAMETSHPEWLLARWERRYGREAALTLAHANNQPPATCFRLNSPSGSFSEIESRLREEGVELSPGKFLKDCRIVEKGNLTQTDPFRRGELIVQDEASQMVPYLLDVQEGQSVLDLCAAPGNKTAQLAQRIGPSGRLIAADLHRHRLREMTSLPPGLRVWKVALDGSQPLPFREPFDRILVDAPCSGTGTLRRHPEIKWRLKPSDLSVLAQKQFRLLESAAAALKAGGRLVYSTCSLEPEENRDVIKRFVEAHSEFRLLPLREEAERLHPFLIPASARILERDFLETFPDRDGTDGFFAAILHCSNAPRATPFGVGISSSPPIP